MDARLIYEGLMKEIAVESAALKKKKDLADFLRERIEGLEGTVKKSSSVEPDIFFQRPKTLTQYVTEAAHEMTGEFVVGEIFDLLASRNIAFPENPKSKITTILARLVERGILEVTFKGGGNVPNRYKVSSLQGGIEEEMGDEDDLGL